METPSPIRLGTDAPSHCLHLVDAVVGAAHFDVAEERARRIVGELAARLPGFLVPRLVREIAGAPAKVVVASLLP